MTMNPVKGMSKNTAVIRDQQEAATVRVHIDEARVEQLLAGHNPFAD
jgi:hypothetical protein